MTTARKDSEQPKPLPAPNSDFYELAETLNAEELGLLRQVRAFMETQVAVLRNYWISIPYACWPADKAHNAGCETALDERLPSRDNSQGQEPFSQRTPWR